MGHDAVSARKRVSHQVVIGSLEERVDGGWFIFITGHPCADRREIRGHLLCRLEKEAVTTMSGPLGKGVVSGSQFAADTLNAEHAPLFVRHHKPVPEGRTKHESVVQILGLDEDVGVEEIHGARRRSQDWRRSHVKPWGY